MAVVLLLVVLLVVDDLEVDLSELDRLDLTDEVRAGTFLVGSAELKVCRDGIRWTLFLVTPEADLVDLSEDLLETARLGVRGAPLLVPVVWEALFMGVTDRSDLELRTRSGLRGGERSTRALPDSVRTGFLWSCPVELLLLREGSFLPLLDFFFPLAV